MVSACGLYAGAKDALAKAGVDDPAFDANALFTHTFGKNRLLCGDADCLDESACHTFETLVAQRAARVPLQYLLGSWPFMGLELAVGPGVLVPRPETETLCRTAAGLVAQVPSPAVLDLCAGTGAVGLGIQTLLPSARVTCVEAFPESFAWLKKNLHAFGTSHTGAVQADVFDYYKAVPAHSFDSIVSNPPYVSDAEYETLAPELYHEPKQALVADENGLLFYRLIAKHYRNALKPGGVLAFEIGATQAGAVGEILTAAGYAEIKHTQDQSGHDRVVTAKNSTAGREQA